MSRFVNLKKREVEQLDLSGGDYVLVKKVLTNAERRHIKYGSFRMTAKPGDETSALLDVDFNRLDFERVYTFIQDWSFTDDEGKKVQFNRENLELLDETSYKEIVEALDKYVGQQEKEKNSDSPLGRRLKQVGAGSTSTT